MFKPSSKELPSEVASASGKTLSSVPASSHDHQAEGEAMTLASFPGGVSNIVFDYLENNLEFNWSGDEETQSKPFSVIEFNKFSLFGFKSEYFISKQAAQAATLILRGEKEDIEKAVCLVKQNPHIVHCVTRAFDPLQRDLEGTLIQIAAMAGDVDLKPGIVKEEEQGVVERLIAVAGLSSEEVAEQLKVVTSEEAIRENEARNQQILGAIKRFGEGIIALESKDDDSLEQFQAKCQPLIDQLEKDLRPDPKPVITLGYIFDPKILKEMFSWYEANFNHFGNWSKRNVFMVNGYGKLQANLSSRDAQVVRRGIDLFINNPEIPVRTLNNEDGSSYFYNSQSRLGIDFYLGYFRCEPQTRAAAACSSRLELLCRTKTAVLQNVCNGGPAPRRY